MGLHQFFTQSTGYHTAMTLSTEQLLRAADTLEKALSELALLPSHARTYEQDIFLVYIATQRLSLLSCLSRLPANFYARPSKPLMPHPVLLMRLFLMTCYATLVNMRY
jgi:hypothetical protein